MGLFNKISGFLGRIGRKIKDGVKTAWDWVTGHEDAIRKAADTVSEYIPDKYKDAYNEKRAQFEQKYQQGKDFADKMSGLFRNGPGPVIGGNAGINPMYRK